MEDEFYVHVHIIHIHVCNHTHANTLTYSPVELSWDAFWLPQPHYSLAPGQWEAWNVQRTV